MWRIGKAVERSGLVVWMSIVAFTYFLFPCGALRSLEEPCGAMRSKPVQKSRISGELVGEVDQGCKDIRDTQSKL